MDKNSKSNKEDSYGLSDLEWIQLRKELDQHEQESFPEKVHRKFTEEPLIPLGAIATTTCLVCGLINFRKGDKIKQQFYMRGRVLAQGFTVGAFIVGLLYTTAKKINP